MLSTDRRGDNDDNSVNDKDNYIFFKIILLTLLKDSQQRCSRGKVQEH